MHGITGKTMRGLARTARLAWIFLLLVVALPAQTREVEAAQVAETAQDGTIVGEWEITFEVIDGEMDSWWIGRVWDYSTAPEGEIIAQERVEITDDCEVIGNPTFGENDVTFDGQDDYIRCLIPNFQAIFAQMAPILANCRCRFEGPPYAAADISPLYSTAPQPVIYHNRLYLEVMHRDAKSLRFPFIWGRESTSWLQRAAARLDANNSLGLARLTLRFNGGEVESWDSNIFNVWQNDGFQIWAGYNAARYAGNTSQTDFAKFLADEGFWDVVQPDYETGFLIWESEAESKYTEEAMPSGFGLAALGYIYIGHNPTLKTYYNGKIRAVAVDPGCRGH
jgi:hypothetical protein